MEDSAIYDAECSYFRIDELRIDRASEVVIRQQDLPIQQLKAESKVDEKKPEEKKAEAKAGGT